MRAALRRFLWDERGATALEYAVIASMASITIIAGAKSIGFKLSNLHFSPLMNGFN